MIGFLLLPGMMCQWPASVGEKKKMKKSHCSALKRLLRCELHDNEKLFIGSRVHIGWPRPGTRPRRRAAIGLGLGGPEPTRTNRRASCYDSPGPEPEWPGPPCDQSLASSSTADCPDTKRTTRIRNVMAHWLKLRRIELILNSVRPKIKNIAWRQASTNAAQNLRLSKLREFSRFNICCRSLTERSSAQPEQGR